MKTVTRFAPSPTGYLHIGGLRTALYCYLYAKHNEGKYILRIEDTDQNRYVEGSVENLINSLSTCGIINDEGPKLDEDNNVIQVGESGPYFQSQRLEIYKKYLDKLIEEGNAYYCFCSKDRLDALRKEQVEKNLTPKYDGKCKDIPLEEAKKRVESGEEYVIRLKLPKNKDVVFEDIIRGEVSINTDDIDEQVLLKADGFPTYHFAVVIDDHFMGVNCVIRGEEWLVSTPKHIILYDYLEFDKPKFAHLPSVLNKNKKKLSKRHDSVAVEDFLQKGYLPEALVNYIAMLGWSSKEGKDIMLMEELISEFDLKDVNKAGAVFDIEKLNWVNSHYIKEMDSESLLKVTKPFVQREVDDKTLKMILELVKEKMEYLSQINELIDEIYMEADFENFGEEEKEVMRIETNLVLFEKMLKLLSELEDVTQENVFGCIKAIQKGEKIKGKALYMPIRIAINGVMHGSDLAGIIAILGKDESIRRLKKAMEQI